MARRSFSFAHAWVPVALGGFLLSSCVVDKYSVADADSETGGVSNGGDSATGGNPRPGGAVSSGGVGGTPDETGGGGVSGAMGGTVNTGGTGGSGGAPSGGGGASSGGASGGGTGGVSGGGTGGVSGGGTGGVGGGGTGGGGTGGAPTAPRLITSGPGNYWQQGEATLGGSAPNITVSTNQALQTWTGWGGTFNERGWDALSALNAQDRDLAISLLFGVEGCNFTYGRIPIGATDFALSRYSLNETPNDFAMDSFSIARDRENLIPYIKAALAVKSGIRFWASPWSPPTWMKDNNAFDRGNLLNDAQTLDAHALYLARFVEEYASEGINIEAIHPQNEPGWEQDYPSCGWDPQTYTTYIANHLGPLFSTRLPDVEIWLGTMSNGDIGSSIVSAVMANTTARGYIDGISLQWELGDSNFPTQYAANYSVPIMQSEHKCGNYPWESGYQSTAPNDHAYAVESWGLFKNWIGKGVNSYLAWNMVLDDVGLNMDVVRPWAQNALLAVNVGSGQLIITPTYYVFRHLAQYVEPGSVRLATQGGDALAWRNPDGSVVTVMYNSTGSPAATTLSVDGTTMQFQIPANGWATVDWQGP